jgi:hypothetical protein
MLEKYRHLNEQERWIEYGRIKSAWVKVNGYGDPKAYDEMVKKACEDLGI